MPGQCDLNLVGHLLGYFVEGEGRDETHDGAGHPQTHRACIRGICTAFEFGHHTRTEIDEEFSAQELESFGFRCGFKRSYNRERSRRTEIPNPKESAIYFHRPLGAERRWAQAGRVALTWRMFRETANVSADRFRPN